jgi:hypothetical protein
MSILQPNELDRSSLNFLFFPRRINAGKTKKDYPYVAQSITCLHVWEGIVQVLWTQHEESQPPKAHLTPNLYA